LDLSEVTKTVLSWFGIELVETDQEPHRDDDDQPTPPHHIGPDGRPPRYKET
jgi:hypothetical protein